MLKDGLFTEDKDNTKLAKGHASRYKTISLFLSPHKANSQGVNLCPFASPACVAACLNTAGLAGFFPHILQARRRKSDEFLADRAAFIERLKAEIETYQRRAKKHGKRLAVRLNGTSDIDWPAHIFTDFPNVTYYDYTKSPYRMRKWLNHDGSLPPNYHLTFSYSGENEQSCLATLKAGGNVAAVFSSSAFPKSWQGFRVKTGEENDLRFLDKGRNGEGLVIGLKAKGKARKQVEGSFVIQIDKKVTHHAL